MVWVMYMNKEQLDRTVARMASYPNPLEPLNSIYGSHPDPESPDKNGKDYFSKIFGK